MIFHARAINDVNFIFGPHALRWLDVGIGIGNVVVAVIAFFLAWGVSKATAPLVKRLSDR